MTRSPLGVPVAVGVVAAAVAATLTLPGGAGLGGRFGWAQLVPFRPILGVGALTAGAALVPIAAWRGTDTRTGATAAAVAAVGLVAGAGQFAVLAARGGRNRPAPAPAPARGITVVVANALHSGADPDALVRLLAGLGVDVVALPECDADLAGTLAAGLAATGRPMQVFTVPTVGEVAPTALLVAADLGPYVRAGADGAAADPAGAAGAPGGAGAPGTVVARPAAGDGTVFAAVHPFPPRSRAETATWRTRSAEAAALAGAFADAVVAGDFNATLDHPALRLPARVADAARQAHAAALATWPSSVPRWRGAPIDHVLLTRATWRATAVWTEDIVGSDHRAVVARLDRVGGDVARTTT